MATVAPKLGPSLLEGAKHLDIAEADPERM